MIDTLIGYARCSTDKQDLTVQRRVLIELGGPKDRIYTDHGLTGRTRVRPGLAQALAAVRAGETLVVPKLDRLALLDDGRLLRVRKLRCVGSAALRVTPNLLAQPRMSKAPNSTRKCSSFEGAEHLLPQRKRAVRGALIVAVHSATDA